MFDPWKMAAKSSNPFRYTHLSSPGTVDGCTDVQHNAFIIVNIKGVSLHWRKPDQVEKLFAYPKRNRPDDRL